MPLHYSVSLTSLSLNKGLSRRFKISDFSLTSSTKKEESPLEYSSVLLSLAHILMLSYNTKLNNDDDNEKGRVLCWTNDRQRLSCVTQLLRHLLWMHYSRWRLSAAFLESHPSLPLLHRTKRTSAGIFSLHSDPSFTPCCWSFFYLLDLTRKTEGLHQAFKWVVCLTFLPPDPLWCKKLSAVPFGLAVIVLRLFSLTIQVIVLSESSLRSLSYQLPVYCSLLMRAGREGSQGQDSADLSEHLELEESESTLTLRINNNNWG